MGKIDVLAKWDLEKGVWNQKPAFSDYGRSFAIANYDTIINDDGKIDYIIIAQGSRVEDHSKDSITIKDREVRIDNVLSHYRNCNGNYAIKLFLMDADAPIIEDAKLLASYIDSLASNPMTNSVNVIGLSKCSVMNFYIPSFFRNPNTFNKTNVYNIAAPYDGTKLASPLVFYPEVKKVISSKVHNEKVADLIYRNLINVYEGISSNSHMDYDIAIPSGIPTTKANVYDENFIKEVFRQANVDAIRRLNSFKNMVTGIDDNTLKEAIRTMNFTGIGLCILDDMFFNNQSDGMVYTTSQERVGRYLDVKSHRLVSSHHDVNSNLRVFNEVLGIVDDTIDKFNREGKIKQRVR